MPKLTGRDIEKIMFLAQSTDVISLNTPITADGETTDYDNEIGNFVEDPGPGPEDLAIMADRADILMTFIRKYLKPREQEIIIARFGLENGNPMTLEALGEQYGLTRERVRQLEMRSIRKLRAALIRNHYTEDTF